MVEKGKKFLTEFKEFALKGNVLDLAIAVIIGGAFNKIVSSLVQDIIMPLFGVIIGGSKFTDLSFVLKKGVDGKDITLNYGMFIQNVVDFLIIALSIFIFIKIISNLNKKNKEIKEDIKEPKLTIDQELLIEIRDLLKK